MYFVLMGVSGSGKSTLSRRLSKAYKLPFFEADDFHPRQNIKKMELGVPLEDEDSKLWLEDLTSDVRDSTSPQAIIACSALTPFVQSVLDRNLPEPPVYVLIEVSQDVTRTRMDARENHFMPTTLLTSQFEALRPPESAFRVSNNGALEDTYARISEIIETHLCES